MSDEEETTEPEQEPEEKSEGWAFDVTQDDKGAKLRAQNVVMEEIVREGVFWGK